MNYYELSQEIYFAIKKGMPAVGIYHHGDDGSMRGIKEFNLPSPQLSGTYTQQDTYARMRASSMTDDIRDYVNTTDHPVTIYKIYTMVDDDYCVANS